MRSMKCYVKDYPRPQFVRKNWENLNGTWDFSFDDNNIGEREKWYCDFKTERTICVPFSYETVLSGIGDETCHENVWYHRTICVDAEKLKGNRYILHFEGSDFVTKVWVNGHFVGSHRGGYTRFSFDITQLLLDGDNDLTVKVEDSLDLQQPRGKQRWQDHNYACWYVQTTGIWKTVWSEYVPECSLSYVKMTPDLNKFVLELEYDIVAPETSMNGDLLVETVITYDDVLVSKTYTAVTAQHMAATADMTLKNDRSHYYNGPVWTPETPSLYDVEFRLLRGNQVLDEVGSYAAMRDIRIDGKNILLNGMLLYQKLILAQGYWKDSHLTAPDEDALVRDIDSVHALGYNGLRIHQKNEDERFLYWCDVKGMLVWSEAPSAYLFSDYAADEFIREWLEQVRQNYNHPCIITWTPVNESWGVNKVQTNVRQQHFTEAVYHATKMLDPYRPVIVNDGWIHTISDIITLHDYEVSGERLLARYADPQKILSNEVYFDSRYPAFANGYAYRGQPVLISEFGGIALNDAQEGWGYGEKVKNKDAFVRRFDDIVTAVKKLPYVCGYCYTQHTDVQQEINGLLDIDRNYKIDPKIVKEINQRQVNPLQK